MHQQKDAVQRRHKFGAITLRVVLLLTSRRRTGLASVALRGNRRGSATRVVGTRGQRSVEHTQAEARACLVREHGLTVNDRAARLAGCRKRFLHVSCRIAKSATAAWLKQRGTTRRGLQARCWAAAATELMISHA